MGADWRTRHKDLSLKEFIAPQPAKRHKKIGYQAAVSGIVEREKTFAYEVCGNVFHLTDAITSANWSRVTSRDSERAHDSSPRNTWRPGLQFSSLRVAS